MNRVWVTRDEKEDGPLCSALRACAVLPILEPVLERVVIADVAPDLQILGPEDWLVLTSVFAIENVPVDLARIPKVAVVGEVSETAAKKRGLRVELVSRKKTGWSLFAELQARAVERQVIYPRSALAKVPTNMDSAAGFSAPILYETRPRDFDASFLDEIGMIALTSASAARTLDARIKLAALEIPLASIGPTTTAAIEECHGQVWIQPLTPSLKELANAIAGGLASASRE